MKLDSKKSTQLIIILLCILLRPAFMKVVGIDVNLDKVGLVSRMIADIVIMVGMAQLIWFFTYYVMKLLCPSFFRE